MGPIDSPFVRPFFSFCFRPSAPISSTVYPFTVCFYHPHIPHPRRLRARCCVPAYFTKIYLLLHAFSSFRPLPHLASRVLVIYCLGLAHIMPVPGQVKGRHLRSIPSSLFVCFLAYQLRQSGPPSRRSAFRQSVYVSYFSVVPTALADHVPSSRRLKSYLLIASRPSHSSPFRRLPKSLSRVLDRFGIATSFSLVYFQTHG